VSAVAGLDPGRAAQVDVDGFHIELRVDGDLTPVEAVAHFLRELAAIRIGAGYGHDELIEVAQQLDDGDGP
jgi:hypothetical protein